MHMTKVDRRAVPVWERVSKSARIGSDRKRGLYVAARRVLIPARSTARTLAARSGNPPLDLRIDPRGGFLVLDSQRFPESAEIVALARAKLGEVDPDEIRKRGKPFMTPILDGTVLTRESPLLRLALRQELLAAVARYLRVAPVLAAVDVLYSRAVDRELMSSQLLHCDGDDTRQIKLFILCTPVDDESGPLMIMDADRSHQLRRRLGYKYRNRVTDEEARAVLGELDLAAVVGEPGTTCLVDTSRCFHYGSRVAADDGARLVAMIQYVTPYSFMLPRDYRAAAPFRHLGANGASGLQRLALGIR
jgi:hypothetical protein